MTCRIFVSTGLLAVAASAAEADETLAALQARSHRRRHGDCTAVVTPEPLTGAAAEQALQDKLSRRFCTDLEPAPTAS